MSSQVAEMNDSYSPEYAAPAGETFDYRPVPVLAVVALVLGLLSVMAFFGITGMIVAAVGVIISGISLLKILRARGELGGRRLATIGLACSVLFLGTGVAYQRHLYVNEVPAGFERVSFTQDIAKKAFVVFNGQQQVSPDVQKLVGKQIFVKGFMYPTGEVEALQAFLMCRDSGTCCFGGEPPIQDRIGVVMLDGKSVDYFPGRVAVAGEFALNPEFKGGKLDPVFLLKCRIVNKSQTAF